MDAYQQKKEGKRPEQQYFRPGKQKSEGGERVRRTWCDNKRAKKPTHKQKHHQKKIDIQSSETVIESLMKDNFMI